MGAGPGQTLPNCPAAPGMRGSFSTVSYSQGTPEHWFSPQILLYGPGWLEPPQSRAQLGCPAEHGSPCSSRGVGSCLVEQLLWGGGRGAPCSHGCTPRCWPQWHLTGGCPSPCAGTVLTRDIRPSEGSCSIRHRQDSHSGLGVPTHEVTALEQEWSCSSQAHQAESSSDTHHCF